VEGGLLKSLRPLEIPGLPDGGYWEPEAVVTQFGVVRMLHPASRHEATSIVIEAQPQIPAIGCELTSVPSFPFAWGDRVLAWVWLSN